MDNALYYLALNRQIGLSRELDLIANNIANMDTAGFRREGIAFTEHVVSSGTSESVSMADLGARFASTLPGEMTITNGQFDLAIEGDGFFTLETPAGPVLTRAGTFMTSPEGFLVTPNGDRVLDAGEAPIVIPADVADVTIGQDGTISANGDPIAQVGIFNAPQELMSRHGDTGFKVEDDAFEPTIGARLRQGAIEQSNVNPVVEIARLIEVTRAYETAQSLILDEDERVTSTIQTLGQTN